MKEKELRRWFGVSTIMTVITCLQITLIGNLPCKCLICTKLIIARKNVSVKGVKLTNSLTAFYTGFVHLHKNMTKGHLFTLEVLTVGQL